MICDLFDHCSLNGPEYLPMQTEADADDSNSIKACRLDSKKRRSVILPNGDNAALSVSTVNSFGTLFANTILLVVADKSDFCSSMLCLFIERRQCYDNNAIQFFLNIE